MSTRNRRTSPAMVEAWTMPVLFNYLLQQKHLGSAMVQLGGLEPPTSCSTDSCRTRQSQTKPDIKSLPSH